MSRLAFPECTPTVQDKIACAQFVSALTDSFLKRTLHLEGIISLKTAIEKSIAIRTIQEDSFPKGEWNNFREKVTFSREKSFRGTNETGTVEKREGRKKFFRIQEETEGFAKFSRRSFEKKCWQCGVKGHFRSKCPKEGKPGLVKLGKTSLTFARNALIGKIEPRPALKILLRVESSQTGIPLRGRETFSSKSTRAPTYH